MDVVLASCSPCLLLAAAWEGSYIEAPASQRLARDIEFVPRRPVGAEDTAADVSPLKYRQRMRRRACAANQGQGRGGEQKFVAPFLDASHGKLLGIGIVDQGQA